MWWASPIAHASLNRDYLRPVGIYAVTGSASGIGGATAQRLRDAGHTVIGVDIKTAEVVADLSTPDGRNKGADGVLAASGGRLDGAVLAAGLGPAPGADRPHRIAQVNYLGVVDLLDAWRTALAGAEHAKVVVISSNSTTTVPAVPKRAVRALLSHDAGKAERAARWFGKNASVMMYAASKIAVSRWVRRNAVTQQWAGAGIRLNALAPGAVLTPMLQEQLSTPKEAQNVRSFPIPIGGFGDAGQLADWVCFMLSDAADFLCGSVVFVDGGSDAYFRADDWPRAVPAYRLISFLKRFRAR
jgi:NAD(P)-dependent dehydrogenase (short-subunit alcohol dehydrogenase family)